MINDELADAPLEKKNYFTARKLMSHGVVPLLPANENLRQIAGKFLSDGLRVRTN